jgi:hypothetical protein
VERPRIRLAQGQGSAMIAQAARAESARWLRSKRHRSSQIPTASQAMSFGLHSPTFKKCTFRGISTKDLKHRRLGTSVPNSMAARYVVLDFGLAASSSSPASAITLHTQP